MLGFHLRGSEDKIKLIYLIIQVLKRKIAIIYTCEFFKKSLRQEYDLNCFKVGNNKVGQQFLLLNLLTLNSLKIKYFSIAQYREVFSFKNDDY